MGAAIELFDEQGYEATTVAEIAERAGLTKRTFFRYFSDKREVLFSGSQELQRLWLEGLATAPAEASPLAAVIAGLDPVAEMFAERHPFARIRTRIIEANPELQERELIKLQTLAAAIKARAGGTGRLGERGDPRRPRGRDRLSRGIRSMGAAERSDRVATADRRVATGAAVGDRDVIA